jgi:hypothetical protein
MHPEMLYPTPENRHFLRVNVGKLRRHGAATAGTGTSGTIRFYRTDTGYRACTLACGYDGRTRALERHGKTKAAAERALKAALRDRAGDDITSEARGRSWPRPGTPG